MNGSPTNIRRLIACLLDWYACSVLIALIENILAINKTVSIQILSFEIGCSAIMITLIYFGVIPLITKGQTFGKKIMRLRIVKNNGEYIQLKNIMLREFLGVFLFEGSIYVGSNYLREMIQMLVSFNLIIPWSIISSIITIVSIIYSQFNKSRRMFHDLLGDTKVILFN